jgi:hypothetical protein
MGEWSDWIEHDGKGCPVWGSRVQVKTAKGRRVEGIAGRDGGHSWCWVGGFDRITRYRYRRKPAALLLLERIAADPGECPTRRPVPA